MAALGQGRADFFLRLRCVGEEGGVLAGTDAGVGRAMASSAANDNGAGKYSGENGAISGDYIKYVQLGRIQTAWMLVAVSAVWPCGVWGQGVLASEAESMAAVFRR